MRDVTRPGLNADLGEGFPHDAALLRRLDRASVACGGHAGSAASMARVVRHAVAARVLIGAHVSYPDRRRFGRVTVRMSARRLAATLLRQAVALARIAARHGAALDHVKPHGALYHDASRDRHIAAVVGGVIRRLGRGVAWIGDPGGWQERTARRMRIHFMREGFADRAYAADGSLVTRSAPGALLRDSRAVARQVARLRAARRFDAICVHSDTPGCVRLADAARRALRR